MYNKKSCIETKYLILIFANLGRLKTVISLQQIFIILMQGCLHLFLGVGVAQVVVTTPTPNTYSNTPILGCSLGVILGVTPNLGVFYI